MHVIFHIRWSNYSFPTSRRDRSYLNPIESVLAGNAEFQSSLVYPVGDGIILWCGEAPRKNYMLGGEAGGPLWWTVLTGVFGRLAGLKACWVSDIFSSPVCINQTCHHHQSRSTCKSSTQMPQALA